MIWNLSELPLDDGTRAAILKAGIGLDALVDHASRGTLQSIPGIGAGRAAAIDAALVAAGQIDPPTPSDRPPPAAVAAPDQDEGEPATPVPGPAPVAAPAAPDSGFTTYADQVASWARVRLRVDGLADGAGGQAWFVQAGLPGAVVDALELVVKPAGDATARTVYVLADDEGVHKFTAAGGSGRFGHRELSGKVVAE